MSHRHTSPTVSEQAFDIASALVPDKSVILSAPSDASGVSKAVNSAILDNGDEDDNDESFIATAKASSNKRSSTANAKRAGGFQSMGMNPTLLKSITRKGFSVPTPIQRKTIPLILDNQDVVGMARTGSGKTAAFVIPMVEKLKGHSVKVGVRALILSPSRELALQTMRAVKEFGRGTDLRTILVVGGDSLEEQFGQMSHNPDIIIATPGRFLHLLVEMSLDLSTVRYAVFDEADRLFEMGFATQLAEILNALPVTRQTLLFSATLPANLVEFARAGLRDPNLVRLDAESKISPDLESAFFTVKTAEKEGALLHILQDLIQIPFIPAGGLGLKDGSFESIDNRKRKRENTKSISDIPTPYSTIIFAATKHHVEYITLLLRISGFGVSYVYGSLDQSARRLQVDLFRNGKTTILVVTDVAARGIDIPLLANVINYDFPSQPKVFVHRVGRTARAGRKGRSYSLVSNGDVPYLLDLQLFLGRRLIVGHNQGGTSDPSDDLILGRIPRSKIEEHLELVTKLAEDDDEVSSLKLIAIKGEKLYSRTRNAASAESVRRAKTISECQTFQEPSLIYDDHDSIQTDRDNMLARISGFRPPETVFELGRQKGSAKTEAARVSEAMRTKVKNSGLQRAKSQTVADVKFVEWEDTPTFIGLEALNTDNEPGDSDASIASDQELETTHSDNQFPNQQAEVKLWQDSANFMSYEPTQTSLAEDRGYGVFTGSTQFSGRRNFLDAARHATVELGTDEARSFAEPSRARQMRWDKRSKKYVSRRNDEDGSKGSKMVTGESGQKIAASFRSGRFDAWRRLNRLERLPKTGEQESDRGASKQPVDGKRFKHQLARAPKLPDKFRDDYYKKKKRLDSVKTGDTKGPEQRRAKNELRGVDDVRKQRRAKQKRSEKNARLPRKKLGLW